MATSPSKIGLVVDDICSLPEKLIKDKATQLIKEGKEKELGAEVLFVSPVPPIVGANSGPGTLIAGCLPI